MAEFEEAHMKKNEWLLVNPYLTVGVIGASFCFAWFFSLLLTADEVSMDLGAFELQQPFHFVFAATLVIAFILFWRGSDFCQNHRMLLLLISIICSLSSTLVKSLFSDWSPLALAVPFLEAVGISSLASLWIEFICVHLKMQARTAVASVLALALFWRVYTLLIEGRFVQYLNLVFSIISIGIYLIMWFHFSLMDTMPSVNSKVSDSQLRISWKPSLLTFMGSVAQGFSLYWLLKSSSGFPLTSALIEILSLSVFVVLLVDSMNKLIIRESFVRKLFLPFIAACILALVFLPSYLWVWPCLLAFTFSLLPYASAIFATCEHIVRYNLSAIRVFSWARLYSSSGLFFGLGIGWATFSSTVFGDMTLQIWAVIIVMFFILISTVVSTESFYPGDGPILSAQVRIGTNGEIIANEETIGEDVIERYHINRCEAIARHYGLTKRQTEVLSLLAKGRNAAYVEEKLAISNHTARSHIYTIYRILDVHSQQELINLIENDENDDR